MAEVIRMPRMSDTMEEGNIVGWLKEVGDTVEPGDVLAEVETDKATMELESFHEGVLLHIGVMEGAVPVNAVLAVIGAAGEDYQAALDAEGGAPATPAAAGEANSTAPAPTSNGSGAPATAPAAAEPAAAETSTGTQASPEVAAPTDPDGARKKASPLARSIAAEAGLDISQVQGSGDGGRVVKRDVESAIGNSDQPKQQAVTPPAPAQVPSFPAPAVQQAAIAKPSVHTNAADTTGGYTDAPTSQMRKVIARRLAESKFSAPHFYLGIEVDMTEAIAYRKQLNTLSDTRVSFNDLVVKSCAHALRKHRIINSSWMGEFIRYNEDINIGVAVAVEDGLLVPVVRHADRKGFSEINAEVKKMAGLAKDRKLQPQQMSGNTFTISNLGMFDITEFTAIINPPDACILAVGSIQQKPVVKNGEIVVGNVMKLTLSCDHRVVDGASGAAFLATLKGMLEQPMTILL